MWKKFFYKLSKDLLISLVITYFLILVPELILPGIVSSHFNPKYLLISVLLLGLFLSQFERIFKTSSFFTEDRAKAEDTKFRAISRSLLNIILFVVAVMLVLSLYKMKFWQIAFVTAISLPLLIGAENILIREKD